MSNMSTKKRKRVVTPKEGKYLLARIEGNPRSAAARIAGYQGPPSSRVEKSVAHMLLEAMKASGITPYLISDKLLQGFNATKVDRQGDEHPDYDVRLKYIRTVMELLGVNKTLKVDVNVTHKDSGMTKEELRKLIVEGDATQMQKFLAEQSVIDAEEANIREEE